MLLGILKPDAGVIRFPGRDGASLTSKELGYLPEERGLYREIAVFKQLEYLGLLRGMRRPDAASATRRWLKRMELTDRANDKLETLSKGNQQKVQFIAAILHKPTFAVLDEPFSGLDPINQEFFLRVIGELRQSGMTILLCAHQMNLVERLADRLLLINEGREVVSGTIGEIRDQSEVAIRLTLSVAGRVNLPTVQRLDGVLSADLTQQGQLSLLLKKGAKLGKIIALLANKFNITGIHSEPLTLHEIFVRSITADSARTKKGRPS